MRFFLCLILMASMTVTTPAHAEKGSYSSTGMIFKETPTVHSGTYASPDNRQDRGIELMGRPAVIFRTVLRVTTASIVILTPTFPILLFIRWLARRKKLPAAEAASKLANLKKRRISIFFNTHHTIGLIIFSIYSTYLLLSIASISLYFWFPCLIQDHYPALREAYSTLRFIASTSFLPILALFSSRSIYLVFNGLPIRTCTIPDKVFFGAGLVSFGLFIFFAAEILIRSTVSGGGCHGL